MAEDGFKKTVAVIGLGLLGTSLAMALKAKGATVTGWARRREVRNWAVEQQIISATDDEAEAVLASAAVTVICLPIPEIVAFVSAHAHAWHPGAIVTDIGSVKEVIVTAGEAALTPRGVHFVGSHPMAGTEKSGPGNAFPELYNHAEVFITRTARTDAAALSRVRQLWELIGTSIVEIDPVAHDNLVAHTSHISHLLALSLTEAVLDCDEELRPLRYSGCATGFRDTSRIASSSPKMWREIIENNQTAVLDTMREFERRWHHLRTIIETGDFDAFEAEFAKGKTLRDAWIAYKNRTRNCGW